MTSFFWDKCVFKNKLEVCGFYAVGVFNVFIYYGDIVCWVNYADKKKFFFFKDLFGLIIYILFKEISSQKTVLYFLGWRTICMSGLKVIWRGMRLSTGLSNMARKG